MVESITLFHGSSKIIDKPEFGKGNLRNDYGLGFYCTESLELAKEWASVNRMGGFANAYALDFSGLSVINLNDIQYGILDWLALLVNNRVFGVTVPIAVEARDYLTAHFLPDVNQCDVVRGYRADDSYFTFAMDFLSGAISLRQLSRAMALGELGEQLMLKSRKSFHMLQYIGSEPANGEIYYAKRRKRDNDARDQYLKVDRYNARRPDDLFMLDILREEIKRDDTRLQRDISI